MKWPRRFLGESLPCNLCGASARHVVGRFDRHLLPLRNVLCDVCGLVFLDPMPTRAETERWNRQEYRERYHGHSAPRAKSVQRDERGAIERLTLLRPWLPDGASVLDIGAGTGAFVAAACRAGFQAEGVEPHLGFAAHAQRRYGVRLQPCSLQEASFDNRRFDLITSSHVFEHLPDPMSAFLRVRELLAPAGVFHVLVPDIGDRRRTPIARWHPAHVHGFTRATLTMMALKAGFVLDEYDDGTPQLLLRNAPVPAPWFVYPDHARTMRAFFDTHTWWRHLASATPYRKFVRRMMRFARERSARATE